MLALLFPGQGSQSVGMGRDVCEASAAAREVFERADRALGFELSKVCFEGPEDALLPTEVQQPAILTTSVALLRALEERVVPRPAYMAGHSLGEYTALVASGALDLEDAVRLVRSRGRFMQEAVPEGQGAMAALLGADREAVEGLCERIRQQGDGWVEPANFNAPSQIVISGESAAVAAACAAAPEAGARRALPLPVSAPFHCRLMEPAAERLAAELATIHFSDPSPPVVHNVTAEAGAPAAEIPELLQRQVVRAVRFTESVERLRTLGVDRVLEVGPGRVLAGLVARIDRTVERASLDGAGALRDAAAFVAGD